MHISDAARARPISSASAPYSGLPFWSVFSISRIIACSISSRLTLTVSPLVCALARVTGTCLALD